MEYCPELILQIEQTRQRLKEFIRIGAVVEIPVSQDYVTFVDAADAVWVRETSWLVRKSRRTFYAYTRKGSALHRRILGITNPKTLVDHRDGFGLNNTRDNIRLANFHQNAANRRKISTSTSSRFKGVIWQANTKTKPWMAHIKYKKKKLFLGRYKTEEEAALAYNKAAIKYFGDFAKVNDIDDGSTYYQQLNPPSPVL